MNRAAIACLALLAPAAQTLAHDVYHLTIDTLDGQIVIVAGYKGSEIGHYKIVDGRLYDGSRFAATLLRRRTDRDPFYGWFAGEGQVLTSDHFESTGRLEGGDFLFEIVKVVPLEGQGPGHHGHAELHGKEYENIARSDADSREDRCFWVGVGREVDHQHFSITSAGLWDVTILAWDRNGKYADSAPVTFQVFAIPAPSSLATLALPALIALRRRRR